jgi:aspartyl protease family protein
VSASFDPRRGLIVIQTELFGPAGSILLRFAFDTGATGTMVNVAPLTAIGYDPSLARDRVQVTTGSGVEFAPRISVTRSQALGHERDQFPVLAHTLPASASVDGLVGLDFLRDKAVHIDLVKGSISLV